MAPAPRVILLLALAASAQQSALTDVDHRALVELTGVRETARATIHFKPGDVGAKELDADVAANEAALATLEKTLAMTYRGHVQLFLYRDAKTMQQCTGANDATAAFSVGTVSVHQPHEFRGVHEFVHIYALQFPRGADTSGADGFVTEGLATYLAESDEGVPIHAWAAAYAKGGVLPASLVDFRRSWPGGVANGVHPYHVAGSFVGFLVDRFGIAKVKQWYVDSTEAQPAFGENFARLEREWREWLAKFPLDPAHQKHVLQKLGLDFEPMPALWSKAKKAALFDGKSLSGLVADDAGKWSVAAGVLVGTNDEPWTHVATSKSFGAKIGVRAKLRLVKGNAVKLRVNGSREAIFATWSAYASAGAGFAGNDRVKIALNQWVELVFVADGGRARVYLDGRPVFDLPGAFAPAEGTLGVGVEKGVVEIAEWTAFDP